MLLAVFNCKFGAVRPRSGHVGQKSGKNRFGTVSRFCLGTMMFGGKTDRNEAVKIIRSAVDGGVNFIDTANIYTAGISEEITGEAVRDIRDRVVLASKVGSVMSNLPNAIAP